MTEIIAISYDDYFPFCPLKQLGSYFLDLEMDPIPDLVALNIGIINLGPSNFLICPKYSLYCKDGPPKNFYYI